MFSNFCSYFPSKLQLFFYINVSWLYLVLAGRRYVDIMSIVSIWVISVLQSCSIEAERGTLQPCFLMTDWVHSYPQSEGWRLLISSHGRRTAAVLLGQLFSEHFNTHTHTSEHLLGVFEAHEMRQSTKYWLIFREAVYWSLFYAGKVYRNLSPADIISSHHAATEPPRYGTEAAQNRFAASCTRRRRLGPPADDGYIFSELKSSRTDPGFDLIHG